MHGDNDVVDEDNDVVDEFDRVNVSISGLRWGTRALCGGKSLSTYLVSTVQPAEPLGRPDQHGKTSYLFISCNTNQSNKANSGRMRRAISAHKFAACRRKCCVDTDLTDEHWRETFRAISCLQSPVLTLDPAVMLTSGRNVPIPARIGRASITWNNTHGKFQCE